MNLAKQHLASTKSDQMVKGKTEGPKCDVASRRNRKADELDVQWKAVSGEYKVWCAEYAIPASTQSK